jgi:hypothetical protein
VEISGENYWETSSRHLLTMVVPRIQGIHLLLALLFLVLDVLLEDKWKVKRHQRS